MISSIGVFRLLLIIAADSAVYLIIGMTAVGKYDGIIIVYVFTHIAEISLDSQRKMLSSGTGFCFRIGLTGIWLSFRWLAVLELI